MVALADWMPAGDLILNRRELYKTLQCKTTPTNVSTERMHHPLFRPYRRQVFAKCGRPLAKAPQR